MAHESVLTSGSMTRWVISVARLGNFCMLLRISSMNSHALWFTVWVWRYSSSLIDSAAYAMMNCRVMQVMTWM